MTILEPICAGLLLLAVVPAWGQSGGAPATSAPSTLGASAGAGDVDNNSGPSAMQPPAVVSGQSYPTALTSEERSNYLRGGVVFMSSYSDNAIGALNGSAVSDIGYSILPSVALDLTRSRLHWNFSYAPGFTFYQRESSRNQADENAGIDFEYRMSPHVTLSAHDSFQKSSNVFNQPDPTSAVTVTGGVQVPNFSVISPVADRLSNTGSVGINYQFGLNSMVGASGSFSNLHYPDASEVPGLYDSTGQGGSLFASFRLSKAKYFGATYQYQRLLSFPVSEVAETQTHAAIFFYTVNPTARFSITLFGGPQYAETSDSVQPPLVPSPQTHFWTPAAGASLGWQGRLNSAAIGYTHVISGGGGLSGAVHLDSATATMRQQIVRSLVAAVSGGYSNNQVIAGSLSGATNGHSIQAGASVVQQLGQSLSLQLGYMRLHQAYSNIRVLSGTPDTNREFVSLSYQFVRPLGR